MSDHAPTASQQPEPVADAGQPPVAAEPPATQSSPAVRNRDAWFFVIAAAVIALDQLTKFLVRANLDRGEAWPSRDWFLNIVNISNSGAAFGILQGQTTFLIITSVVGAAAIVLYYFYPPLDHGLLRAALGLQLGGAAGTLIDRIRTGEVTDFVNFNHFPAFNVADASINIGVATIIFFFITVEIAERRKPSDDG